LKSKRYVLSDTFPLKEVAFFVFVFVGVLLLVYPGSKIRKIIFEGEEVNVNLRTKYLEALKKTPEVLSELAESYLRLGKREEAKELLPPDRALFVEFRKLKYEYFSEGANRKELVKKIEEILLKLARTSKDPKLLRDVYRESISFGLVKPAYESSKALWALTRSPAWAKEAIRLAYALGKHEEVLSLSRQVKELPEEVVPLVVNSALTLGKGEEVTELLEELAKEDKKAGELFLFLLARAGKKQKIVSFVESAKEGKKELILIAIRQAIYAGRYELAKELILRWALSYPEDEKFTAQILKLALQTGDPYFAGEVAGRVARALGVLDAEGS